ncbi:glycosyltransferase [Candidatus Nomurabacteria bacterium]|nr:glycosyltransferase [Candidatus Nomurabacteria bacterium]
MTNPKVAIVHKSYLKRGGAERVLEVMADLVPDADIYFLFGSKKKILSTFPDRKVYFSFLQKIPFIKKLNKVLFFLWPVAAESLDLSGYDLVISSSSDVAKGVVTNYPTKHLCYMYSPMRYLWDQKDLYLERYSVLRKIILLPLLTKLRIWDVFANSRIDYLVTISDFVSQRISKYYDRIADQVIYPPVNLSKFMSLKKESAGNYFLALSPFEENKGGVDIVKLALRNNIKLRVTGIGALYKRCKKLARGNKNIEFLGWVSEEEKIELLRHAKGLLFLGVEDFGIAAVEAIAAGLPVFAYKAGGAHEIVINEVNGILCNTLKPQELDTVLKGFTERRWDRKTMFDSVKHFDESIFREKFGKLIQQNLQED